MLTDDSIKTYCDLKLLLSIELKSIRVEVIHLYKKANEKHGKLFCEDNFFTISSQDDFKFHGCQGMMIGSS